MLILISILFVTVVYLFYVIKVRNDFNIEVTKAILTMSIVLDYLKSKNLCDEELDKIRNLLKNYNPEN